jgi:hypothetical protein
MKKTRLRTANRSLLCALVMLIAAGPATANFMDLLRRVPDSANTLIMIDVERLLMSPIAMKEKWRDKVNSSEGEPLHFPIDSVRYMLASKLDFVGGFEDIWDAALIETASDVSLPYLSKMEGGYLDTVEGQQIAFSPRNAFFVSFKPTILGVMFPANRQDLGRWIKKFNHRDDPQVSEYLQSGVQLAHGQDQVVVAFDLGDLFTARQVRDRLRRAESLAGKDVDLDALTKALISIKGVTVTVHATDRLNGKLRVDFGESPTPLKPVAKALLFEALENHGVMLLDEIKDWAIHFEAKAITLDGRLSTKGLRVLTDMIPFPAETVARQDSSQKAGGSSSESAKSLSPEELTATTSKKYFNRIYQVIDTLRTDINSAGSPKLARMMVNKAALEIERLPVLNVDEELIAYGTGVSETFRNMHNLSKNASLDASYRQATMAGNQGYGYGYGGFYGGGNLSLSTSVMRKQETAVLKSNQLAIMTMLAEKTAETRKKMTLKYKVEF